MTKKYLCNNCGKEFTPKTKVVDLTVLSINHHFEEKSDETFQIETLGEFCFECTMKLEKIIKEGIQ